MYPTYEQHDTSLGTAARVRSTVLDESAFGVLFDLSLGTPKESSVENLAYGENLFLQFFSKMGMDVQEYLACTSLYLGCAQVLSVADVARFAENAATVCRCAIRGMWTNFAFIP